jgi:hypothetical protein
MTKGVCYVAWGPQCIAEAVRSAATCPYNTWLITELETDVPHNKFSVIHRTDFAEFAHLHVYYRKLAAVLDSPFDVTMYVDSDTQFVASVDAGFDLAEKYGFAAVLSPGGMFEWHVAGIKREFRHFNGGALWFLGRPVEWAREVMQIGELITNNDEPAWALAWDRLGINPAILPAVFNHVAECDLHPRLIRLWHGRCEVDRTHLTGTPATS